MNFLSTQQNDTGDFGGNSNSTAMVAIGLCAAEVDLGNDVGNIGGSQRDE